MSLLSALVVVPMLVFLHLSHCYRPNELTTVEFGKGWKSVAHEKRQKMETTLTEPSDIQVKLKECLNFHPVEVISESLKTCATNCHASVEHIPLV